MNDLEKAYKEGFEDILAKTSEPEVIPAPAIINASAEVY